MSNAIKFLNNEMFPEKKSEKIKVSKSAFWLSYCAMQKTIRLGDVEASNKFAFVAHLGNPWLTFQRLHTILFEDIGGANVDLIKKFADFHKNGGTYKSFSDVSELVKDMAASIKSRDCDEMKNLSNSKNIITEYLNDENYLFVKGIKKKGFQYYYDNDVYSPMKPLINFIERAGQKLAREGQNLFVPFAINKFIEKSQKNELNIIDYVANEGTDLMYRDLFPYTVLDTHGWHGQMTMNIAWKKLQDKLPSFIEKYNLQFEPFQMFIFHLEGSLCRNEIRLTNVRDISWKSWYYDLGMLLSYEEFVSEFKEIIKNRLNPLREWVFEKQLNKVVLEIENIINNNYVE